MIQQAIMQVISPVFEEVFSQSSYGFRPGRSAKQAARKIKDKRVLQLIRKYLESGIMINGVVVSSEEGTPQGGNLSPLLANIILDDLDKELEKRGHKFCRYADDCNIYVKSKRAGERPMTGISEVNEKVKGWVNYFGIADIKSFCRKTYEWLRRRLIMY